jgi:hypothetical protein
MEYLIGIIMALVGGFFYQKSKRNTAEARNENLETKEKLNDINKDISKNEGQLESEEQKQSNLKKELENVGITQDTVSNIVDFLNSRSKK